MLETPIDPKPKRKRKKKLEKIPPPMLTPACARGDHDACACDCVCHAQRLLGRTAELTRALIALERASSGLLSAEQDRLMTVAPAQWIMGSVGRSLEKAARDLEWTQPAWAQTTEFRSLGLYVADQIRLAVRRLVPEIQKAGWTPEQTRLALFAGVSHLLSPDAVKRHTPRPLAPVVKIKEQRRRRRRKK